MSDFCFTNFDFRLSAKHEIEENDSLYEFASYLVENASSGKILYKREHKVEALLNLIANMLVADYKKTPLVIPLTTAKCSIPDGYGFAYYTHTNIKFCINLLHSQEMVEIQNGFFSRERKQGKRTRLRLTDKFHQEYSRYMSYYFGIQSDMPVGYLINRRKYRQGILLKDLNKQLCRITKETAKKEREDIQYYNNAIESFKVRIQQPPVTEIPISYPLYITRKDCQYTTYSTDKLDTNLYRVFNNSSLEYGGRFYGASYQRLKSDDRRYLTIDGSITTEVDYSAFHPRMLYHMQGIEYMDDPYMVDENNPLLRSIIKELFNMAINAGSMNSAVRAFNNSLHHKEDEDKFLILEYLRYNQLKTKDLIKVIFNKHPNLEKYLFTGIGLKLQNTDSKIANAVMQYFVRLGKPILCIHDSFIVKLEDEALLKVIMKEFYKSYMNGFDCKLKVVQGIDYQSEINIAA